MKLIAVLLYFACSCWVMMQICNYVHRRTGSEKCVNILLLVFGLTGAFTATAVVCFFYRLIFINNK